MGPCRRQLWDPSRCALPGWKLVRQGYDLFPELRDIDQARWGYLETPSRPVQYWIHHSNIAFQSRFLLYNSMGPYSAGVVHGVGPNSDW